MSSRVCSRQPDGAALESWRAELMGERDFRTAVNESEWMGEVSFYGGIPRSASDKSVGKTSS
jgi:hypothetical protein